MIFQYQKNRIATEVLKDLVAITNERIAGYEMAVRQPGLLEADLKEEFKQIIAASIYHKEQLSKKIQELTGEEKSKENIFGKIYKAWKDLKVVFSCNTRRSTLAACQYNEEIALHAYNAALNNNSHLPADIREMLEIHYEYLKDTMSVIVRYKDAPHYFQSQLVYFN